MKFEISKKMNYILSYAFIFSFFILLICFVMFIYIHNYRINNWKHVEGEISSIDEIKEITEVKYNVDGKYQYKDIGFYSTSYKVGDEIDIYLFEDKIYAEEFIIGMIVSSSLGICFGSIGIGIYIFLKKQEKNQQLCLREGIKRKAGVFKFYKTKVKNGFRVFYKMIIVYDNKKYKSHSFYLPKKFIEFDDGIVDIYLHNSGKYYIDIDSYRENVIE